MQSTKQVRDKFVTKFVAFGYLFFFSSRNPSRPNREVGLPQHRVRERFKKFPTLLLAIELMGRKKEKKKEISEVT